MTTPDNFSEVMKLLPKLSQVELATVAFHAQQLIAQHGNGNSRRRPVGGKASSKKGSDSKSQKSSAKSSVFAKVPEYVAFKAADKALRAVLKEEGKTLKELEGDFKSPVDGSQTSAALSTVEAVVNDFYRARNLWFRAKEVIQAKPASTPVATSIATIPETGSGPSSSTGTGSSLSGGHGAKAGTTTTSGVSGEASSEKKKN